MGDANDHWGLTSTRSWSEPPPKVDVECGVELVLPLARTDLMTISPFNDYDGCLKKLDHFMSAKYD